MEIIILMVVGVVLLLTPVMLLTIFSVVALSIFIWRKLFPFGWGMAEWITNRRNLIPFVLFLLIVIAGSIILLILSYMFATQVHLVGYLFILLFLLILIVAEIIFWGGFGLAITLWIVRLSHWAYALFRRGFWRTFRSGGPPDFQPLPVPLTNPVLITLPSSKRTGNRRRQPLAKRPAMISATITRPSKGKSPARAEEQAQVKKEAKRRRPVARRRETIPTTLTSPSNEMALVGVEAKQAKAQTKEGAKRAKAQAKEEAKRAKAQTKEDAKQAKEEAKQAKAQAKQAQAQAREARAPAKEEAKLAKAEARTQTEETTKVRRRRRLRRTK